ncbi:MAG: hypothetical protein KJ955_01680 [Nanoarchaeota archaeon]|nr:hypothetical protein [Nanoarchaeota archaeon]
MANSHAATADEMDIPNSSAGARTGYYAGKGRGFRPWDMLDIRWWKPSEEKREATKSHVLGTVFVLALVLVGVYAVYWGLSPEGKRSLTEVKITAQEYNPYTWYKGKVLEAQGIGDVWESKSVTKEQKGVLFDGFSSGSGVRVTQGMPMTFAYDIKLANTKVSNLKLTMGCKIKGKDIEGDIIPSNPLIISGSRITDYVRCTFPGEITRGLSDTVEVEGTVNFPFKTEDVRLKVYFTSEAMERGLPEGVDFFEYRGISESQPIRAEYKGEPVIIGIGASVNEIQPVVLREGFNPLLGISLTNEWKGVMTKLTSLKLEIPREMALLKELAGQQVSPTSMCPFVLSRQGNERNEYKADESFIQDIVLKDGDEKSTSFECYLDADPELLGNAEYIIKEYKVDAEYEYELPSKTVAITVKALPGQEGSAVSASLI